MRVNHNRLGNWPITGPTQLIHKVTKMIEILLLLIILLINNSQLYLTEQRRAIHLHIHQKILIPRIHPILHPIYRQLLMITQLLVHLFNLLQSPRTLTAEEVGEGEGDKLRGEEKRDFFEDGAFGVCAVDGDGAAGTTD